MLEINRSFELTEMKKPTADGFKCIEPQSKMTSHEAQKYWDSKFDKENNPVKYGGGSYEDVKNYSQENKHENVEAHHTPADTEYKMPVGKSFVRPAGQNRHLPERNL